VAASRDDPWWASPAVLALAVVVSGALGWVAPQAGKKGMALVAGALVFGVSLVLVRQREGLMLQASVVSLAFMLHKSIGPIAAVNSGAPSIYLTPLDVLLVGLYAMWLADGSMGRDLRAGLRRPIMMLPLAGVFLQMFSVLLAETPSLALAEVVRMGWMYALFVYIALRLRSRSDVMLVLRALAVIGLIEFVAVGGQWVTKGPLGLSFLGLPLELGERTLDAGEIPRPFGTITHPTFMGTFMSMLALMALSVGIGLRSSRLGKLALVLAVVCAAPVALAQARAALIGLAVAGVLLVGACLVTGRLRARPVVGLALAGGIVLAAAWPIVQERVLDNFATDHFDLEVQSRVELNDLALEMIRSSPVLGVGLNNFLVVDHRFDERGLIFAENPVHNVFLLNLAETGVVGFSGFVMVGIGLLVVALRLARTTDPLYAAIGAGVAACYVFLIVEEQLGFSLRQDQPLALTWLLAGLSIACLRLPAAPPAVPAPVPAMGSRR